MRMRKTAAILISLAAALAAAGCSSQVNSSLAGIATNPAGTASQSSEAESSADPSSEEKLGRYTVQLRTEADIYYMGEEICPKVFVFDENGSELSEDAFDISYSDNLKTGIASIDITVKENGVTLTHEFEIKPMPLDYYHSKAEPEKDVLDYTGSEQKLSVAVTDANGLLLEEGRDYELSYENAKGPGTVTATATGKGFYTGEIKTSYVIKPQKADGIKLDKAGERSVTLSWNKCEGAQGYQVCLKNSDGYFVLADINTGECAAEINGLEPDTTYTLYIRPYLNSEGETYYADSGEGFKASTLTGAPDKVMITETAVNANSITLKWQAVKDAEQYRVQRSDGSEWKQVGVISGCTFIDKDIAEGKQYRYRVRAERTVGGSTLTGAFSEEKAVTAAAQQADAPKPDTGVTESASSSPKAYYFSAAETVYDMNGNKVGQIAAGSIYGAYRDPEYPNKLVIDYMYGRHLVSDAHAAERPNSVLLETAAIGQMGGSIWGQASCGPTAAAILAAWQKGLNWNKDELILYSEKNRLNDQGSLRGGGGMTAPMLLKLISGYSGGKVTASNIYGGGNTAQKLKEQIDKGNRALVVCQYTSTVVTHYYSGTHFVVVCGYEVVDGVLNFYYADPYYSYGGRSLSMVRSDVLAASMDMVVREPKCIIVLN